jgi:16S rRNA (cytosine1402-N4)-methyltransferase
VNQELTGIFESIGEVIDHLNVGGRICVISFHSLEDRIVRRLFGKSRWMRLSERIACVGVCGKTPQIKILQNTFDYRRKRKKE